MMLNFAILSLAAKPNIEAVGDQICRVVQIFTERSRDDGDAVPSAWRISAPAPVAIIGGMWTFDFLGRRAVLFT